MKQQRFLFVDIVSSIFLLILLIANFLGLLYITEGNIVLSLLSSMFLIVCYFFIIQLLKKNKEQMKKYNYLHSSLIFWVFFIILGVASFFLMSHFINVEYNCKEQVKSEAKRKIDLVDSIATVYKKRAKEDINNFHSNLKHYLEVYKNTGNDFRHALASAPYLISNDVLNSPSYINVDETVNAKKLPFELKIENNIKNLDSTIGRNSSKYQSIFDNWKRLSVVGAYSKLNEYVEDNLRMVNSKIKELPLDQSFITMSYDKTQLPLNNPSKLNIIYPPNYVIPSIAIIVIHLFILIPFFTTKIRGSYGRSHADDPLELENVRVI